MANVHILLKLKKFIPTSISAYANSYNQHLDVICAALLSHLGALNYVVLFSFDLH